MQGDILIWVMALYTIFKMVRSLKKVKNTLIFTVCSHLAKLKALVHLNEMEVPIEGHSKCTSTFNILCELVISFGCFLTQQTA